MFLLIALILLILWALGAFAFAVGGSLIHLLLVLVVMAVVVHFASGGRGAGL